MKWRALAPLSLLAAAVPVSAQSTRNGQGDQSDQGYQEDLGDESARDDTSPGGVATSAVGQAGQRQSQGNAAEMIEPTGRIDTRVQNRVQNRIRNRIDQNYDPLANANAPFATAEEQQRKTGGRQGR
jgi:hypothetical protein